SLVGDSDAANFDRASTGSHAFRCHRCEPGVDQSGDCLTLEAAGEQKRLGYAVRTACEHDERATLVAVEKPALRHVTSIGASTPGKAGLVFDCRLASICDANTYGLGPSAAISHSAALYRREPAATRSGGPGREM